MELAGMTQEHPITPSAELVKQWLGTYFSTTITGEVSDIELTLATQAARWGADQEVGACCQWLSLNGYDLIAAKFHAARRPKPPSLKEQALALISHDPANQPFLSEKGIAIIRRALESLPD